jgi:ABC-2 type transport system ATP-binding protein
VDGLRDLALELSEARASAIWQPNCSGKTTSIRLILGLARPTAGRAGIFGLDCQRRAVEASRNLDYVPGESNPGFCNARAHVVSRQGPTTFGP